MKIDPHKSKEYYEAWKEKGSPILGISKENEKIIKEFIFDLEKGLNVGHSNKKGARSYIRLKSYKYKLKFIAELSEKRYKTNLINLKKEQLHDLFDGMRKGDIKKSDGSNYTNPADYVKDFKSFWHWYQRTSKKKIEDITAELDTKHDKPKWVYLDEKQFKKLAENCKPFYKTIAYFELDTGLRCSELLNTRVSDFSDDFKMLGVRDEVSKTFGRNIKLMMSSELIKEFIEDNNLKGEDILFNQNLSKINEYYKRLAKRLFGTGKTKARESYSKLTVSDMRHISACYWLPRYPTQQGMMYRFGWKKSDKIHYYSEFLGMIDNISQEDMLIDVTKTDLQKQLDELKKKYELERLENKNQIEELKKELPQQIMKEIMANLVKNKNISDKKLNSN